MVFACNLLRASANAREYEEQVRIGDKMGALQNVFSPNLSWRTMISSFFSAFDQFRTMTPIDVVDILVVAYIIYRVMKLLKDTSAARLAKGILVLVLIMLFASFLHLTMISWLLRNALSVGVFAVVVIFQPELRRLLEQLGKGNLSRMLIPDTDPNVVESMIVATVSACADMSRTKTGALIVFERKERLGEIIATGTRVDAAPSAELIKNIFFKNSPLHDGAMIVRAGRVCAAGCVLPLSGNQDKNPILIIRQPLFKNLTIFFDNITTSTSSLYIFYHTNNHNRTIHIFIRCKNRKPSPFRSCCIFF